MVMESKAVILLECCKGSIHGPFLFSMFISCVKLCVSISSGRALPGLLG